MTIFRLVTENTVEEKIVERAQQKLKLDAMVVQQGRLKEKDKVTKEEIMAAVRFGTCEALSFAVVLKTACTHNTSFVLVIRC